MCCYFPRFYWPADEKTFGKHIVCILANCFSPWGDPSTIFIAPYINGGNIPHPLKQNLQHHFLLKMREKKFQTFLGPHFKLNYERVARTSLNDSLSVISFESKNIEMA